MHRMDGKYAKLLALALATLMILGGIIIVLSQHPNSSTSPVTTKRTPESTPMVTSYVDLTSNMNPAYQCTNITLTATVHNFDAVTYKFCYGTTEFQSGSSNVAHYKLPYGSTKPGFQVTAINSAGATVANDTTVHAYYKPNLYVYPAGQGIDSTQGTNDHTTVEFVSCEDDGSGVYSPMGIPPFSYSWTVNGASLGSYVNGIDLNCTFNSPGDYKIGVEWTDTPGPGPSSSTYHFYANYTETVYPPISSNLIISQSKIDVGQEIHFKVNTTGSNGGYTGTYTLTYVNEETTMLTGSGLQFNFTFPTESPFECYAAALSWKVVSSSGAVAYANDSNICVHVDPQISITEEYSSTSVGVNDKFDPTSTYSAGANLGTFGGWSPYVLTWEAMNITKGTWSTIATYEGSSRQPLLYNFSSAGTFDIMVHLRDSAGYQVNSSEVELTVNTALRLNVSIVPSKVVDMHNSEVCSDIYIEPLRTGGSSLDCTSIKVNGASAIGYIETEGNPYKIIHSMPQNPGRYEYCVFASDSTGGSARGYANFTVLSSDVSITTNVPSVTVQGNAYSLDASASAPSYFSFAHDFNLVGYTYSWNIGKTNKTGNSIVYDFSKAGLYKVNLTVKADYVTDFNGQELSAYQEKNVTQTVRVVNSSSSTNIHIKQFKYESSSNYYFSYWVSFTDSSYSTSFYAINHTAYTPQDIQTYVNGSVFVNVSIQDSNYAPGTQDICFTVINNESQTNSVNGSFIISLSQSNQISIYSIANFFGGFYNFLIFIATAGSLVIGYEALRRQDDPNVIIQEPGKNGKTKNVVLRGKKEK